VYNIHLSLLVLKFKHFLTRKLWQTQQAHYSLTRHLHLLVMAVDLNTIQTTLLWSISWRHVIETRHLWCISHYNDV